MESTSPVSAGSCSRDRASMNGNSNVLCEHQRDHPSLIRLPFLEHALTEFCSRINLPSNTEREVRNKPCNSCQERNR
jgi:hypothetical protein